MPRQAPVRVATKSVEMCVELRRVLSFLAVVLVVPRINLADSEVDHESDVDELSFVLEPLDTVAIPSNSVILHCQVQTSESAVEIQWTKDNEIVSVSSSRQLLSNGSLLILNSPEEGTYWCIATVSSIGSIRSRSANLQLAFLDGSFAVEPQNISARLGDVIMFTCLIRAAPLPQIQWLKDDQELDPQGINYFIHPMEQGRGSVLEIRGVLSRDLGRYRCRATSADMSQDSAIGFLKQSVELPTVEDMLPQFVVTPKDSVINEGDGLIMHCAANGIDRNGKRTAISWLRNGVNVDLSFENERFSLTGDGNLKINRIEEDDGGLYTCRASNLENVLDASAVVSVQVSPKVQVVPKKLFAKLRSDQELACVIYGNPRPSVQWYRNGMAVVPDDYVQVVDGHNLRLLGLISSDEAMYQCMATSKAGTAQASVRLKVVEEQGQAASEAQSGVPSKPLDLSAVIISTRFVTLSWKQPESYSLTDVRGYIVSWKEVEAVRERELNTTALEANIQHLKPSCKYMFEVRAFNNIGFGQTAGPFAVTTQDEEQVPDAPVDLQVIPLSSTSLAASWESRPNNLTSPVAGYKLYYYEISDESLEKEIVVGLINSYTLAGLRKFRQYSIRVAALNSIGLGMSTDEVFCQTYSDIPSSSPENVSADVQSATSVIVHWNAPSDDHVNGLLTGYRIEHKQTEDETSRMSVTATDASQRTISFMDLLPGTEYSFSVMALTRNGSGPSSPLVVVSTLDEDLGAESRVPSTPSSLQLHPQANSVVVSWTPPSDQSVLIRGYILGYGIGIPDVYRQILDAKQRYHTIKGLKSSSEYVISLRAFNKAGEGNPLLETAITREGTTPEPATPITPPVGLKATVISSSAIVLTWSDTTLGRNQRVTDNRYYTIRYTPRVQRKPKLINSTDLNVHVEDLRPDTEYEFCVKTVKGRRQSTWSLTVINKTTEAAPGSAPRDITAAVVDNRLDWVGLSWQPPRQPNGQVTDYLIFYTQDATMKDRDWVVEGVPGDRLSITIKDLSLETTYYFKVQAHNSIGYGPSSSTIVFQTPRSDGTGGGQVDMPDDFGRLPRPKENPETRNNGQMTPVPSVSIPTTVLWISIGCIGCITFIAIVVIFGIVCHRKQAAEVHTSRQGYMPANKPKAGSKDLKPPDLWIHDRMESKIGMAHEEIDEGTAMMSRDSQEPKDDADLDSDRFRRMGQRSKPVMIPVDQPLPTRELYLPAISNGIMDANTVVVRPVYPRTQYTCQYAGAPRVNASQIPPQPSDTPGRSGLPTSPSGSIVKPVHGDRKSVV